jgi:hypothetical protein
VLWKNQDYPAWGGLRFHDLESRAGRGFLMRKPYLFSLLMVCSSIISWCQNCPVDGEYSFTDVKSSVLRFTTEHAYTGHYSKIWSRSGDMAALAIVKTVPDAQMTSPNTVREILLILREAWACPRCARSPDDQQPNVTALLLEHLEGNTSGPIQSEITKTRTFILEQTRLPH